MVGKPKSSEMHPGAGFRVRREFERTPADVVRGLATFDTPAISDQMNRLYTMASDIKNLVDPGMPIAGPALTVKVYPGDNLMVHKALDLAEPGDVVVVDARGELSSGVFGEMMMTYFKGKGGAGVVIDGCVRDVAEIKKLGLGLWLRGATPNFHTQTVQFPAAINVPIACGGVLVLPGDIIVADDDGAVVVPIAAAPQLVKKAGEHAEWEEFSRLRLAEGGDLRKYYPLSEEARAEYEAWRDAQGQ